MNPHSGHPFTIANRLRRFAGRTWVTAARVAAARVAAVYVAACVIATAPAAAQVAASGPPPEASGGAAMQTEHSLPPQSGNDATTSVNRGPTPQPQREKASHAPHNQHAVGRVITLAPHVTEMVFAAGAGHKLVATVTASNYPPEALAVPRVGDGLSINAEQLLTLQPDLIIGWQQTQAIEKLTPLLTSLNIPVVYSEPRRLDDIPNDIERLGAKLGTAPAANAAAQNLRNQLAALRATYAHRTPVPVFIEVGTNPLYTLGNDPLTNDAIKSCGGVNVFGDAGLVAPAVPAESVLVRRPQVVIIADTRPAEIARRARYWATLRLDAARQNHVYRIDPDMLVRPGPRLIAATQQLCEYVDKAR